MELLDELKRKLAVTWDDDDAYLHMLLIKAMNYIDSKCGFSFDYAQAGQHKTLMLERCFYDYNNALRDFENNYRSELLALIVETASMPKRRRRG